MRYRYGIATFFFKDGFYDGNTNQSIKMAGLIIFVIGVRGVRGIVTIYLDTLFETNLIINYLILLASAKLSGEVILRRRLLAGAAFGALYAVAVYLPSMELLSALWVKLAIALIMALISFGGSRRVIRLTVIFIAIALSFGGGVYALNLMAGREAAAPVFIDYRVLIISCALFYALFAALFKGMAAHKSGELLGTKIKIGDREARITALMDTGNTLRDPITNKPVMIGDISLAKALLPDELSSFFTKDSIKKPSELFEILSLFDKAKRFRLIPYRAVGVEGSLLVCVKTDAVMVKNKEKSGILLAFSPTPVSGAGGYSALIGSYE